MEQKGCKGVLAVSKMKRLQKQTHINRWSLRCTRSRSGVLCCEYSIVDKIKPLCIFTKQVWSRIDRNIRSAKKSLETFLVTCLTRAYSTLISGWRPFLRFSTPSQISKSRTTGLGSSMMIWFGYSKDWTWNLTLNLRVSYLLRRTISSCFRAW